MSGNSDAKRHDWRQLANQHNGLPQMTDLQSGVRVRMKSVCKIRSVNGLEPCIYLNTSLLLFGRVMALNVLSNAVDGSAMVIRSDLLLTVVCQVCRERRSWSMDSANSSSVGLLSKNLEAATIAGISTAWHLEQKYDGKTCAGRGWPDSTISNAATVAARLISGGNTVEALTAQLSLPITQQPWTTSLKQLATSQSKF